MIKSNKIVSMSNPLEYTAMSYDKQCVFFFFVFFFSQKKCCDYEIWIISHTWQ